jgi:hypothetical protein
MLIPLLIMTLAFGLFLLSLFIIRIRILSLELRINRKMTY